MSFGFATSADVPRLTRLWMDCFGDTEDYVNLYFAHSFRADRVFVLREPEVAAMLLSFPVSFIAEDGEAQEGAYLYAVCTDPAWRGRGLCRALMTQAEDVLRTRGCAFTCLKPGTSALRKMYARMGYRDAFSNRETVVFPVPDAAAPRMEPCTPEAYYGLRQMALWGGFVDYQPEVLAHQARLGRLFSLDGCAGFGALERWGDTAILKEYFGDEALLPGLCRQLGAGKLTVRAPGDQPFAMAKPLTNLPCPTGYLGLAFD